MENFNFKSTTRLVFGKDTHEETGKYVKEYSNKILEKVSYLHRVTLTNILPFSF